MDFSARKMLEGKFLLAGKIDEDNRDAWLGWTHEVFRTELLRAFPRPNTKAASQMTLDDELGRLRVEVNLRDQSPMDKYIGQIWDIYHNTDNKADSEVSAVKVLLSGLEKPSKDGIPKATTNTRLHLLVKRIIHRRFKSLWTLS
jgi:hypothetical protein